MTPGQTRKATELTLVLAYSIFIPFACAPAGTPPSLFASLQLALCAFAAWKELHEANDVVGERFYRAAPSSGLLYASTLVPTLVSTFFVEWRSPASTELLVSSRAAMEILSLSLALAFPTLEAAASYLPGRTFLRTACVAGVILVVGQGLAPASAVRSTAPFVAVYYFLLWLFPRLLPRSFTFGESSLLIQGAVILVFVIHRLGNEFDEESFLSFYAIRAVLLAGLATSPVLALGRTPTAVAPSSNATIPGSAFYITALLVVFFFLVLPLWGKLKPDPISWAVQFVLVSATRPSLVCYWVLSLGTIAAVYSWLASGAATKAMLNLKRKYYHLLATAMFWPAAILDPNLLFVAFAAAFALFLLLEYLRIGRIWPAGEVLDAFLKSFLDERDSGLMIVSHTYLLLGCSIPLWLAKARDFRGLGGFAGILTLGIADTAASLIGIRYGKHRWPGTSKTVEGSAAFIVALWTASTLTASVVSGAQALSASKLLLPSVFVGVVEAFLSQNDNLILPLMYFTITTCLK